LCSYIKDVNFNKYYLEKNILLTEIKELNLFSDDITFFKFYSLSNVKVKSIGKYELINININFTKIKQKLPLFLKIH
jgi:hypothetical protein